MNIDDLKVGEGMIWPHEEKLMSRYYHKDFVIWLIEELVPKRQQDAESYLENIFNEYKTMKHEDET